MSGSFASKLAWCSVSLNNNNVSKARERCHQLLNDSSLNDAQREKLRKKLNELDHVKFPLPIIISKTKKPANKGKARMQTNTENGNDETTEKATQNVIIIKDIQNTQMLYLGKESYVDIFPNYLKCDTDQFTDFQSFIVNNVPPSPNPMNPKTYLHRLQCTFALDNASSYEFGQENKTFRSNVEQWPLMVQQALHVAKESAKKFGLDPNLYNGVHANLFNTGSVGLNPHFDKERSMVSGAPIFSFTLLSDESLPRFFSIYTLDKEKLYDILLPHGCMLVMRGQMQQWFKHGVEPMKPPKMYKNLARINLTVRAFKVESSESYESVTEL